MALSPGERIDRYEIVALLGRGGMGEVYRVRDPRLERDVALKIVRVDGGFGTDGGPRLLREARAAAALSHPNVLAVFDVGEVQEPEALRGLAYIAMELVVGDSLRAFVGDATVSMPRRIGWLRDVAAALAAAHQAGLVHRDVKPENVMVRDDGAVKVLDFGIARRTSQPLALTTTNGGQSLAKPAEGPLSGLSATLTAQGFAMGTPLYMAPEQLRAEPLDGRADQFAWGVVAYELLTGRVPWDGTDAIAIVSTILSRDPPSPRAIDARIPPRVSRAVLRALAKDPDGRFRSMRELIEQLESPHLESAPATWPAVSPVAESTLVPSAPPSKVPSSRRRAAAIAAATVGVCAAAIVATVKPWRVAPAAAPPPAVEGQCTSSAACSRAHSGGAWRCNERRHACVEIASPDCRASATPSDLARDDTVWLGGLFPLTGDAATDIASETRAFELARRDFAEALGAGGPRTGDLHARAIATVTCDEAVDPVRAVRHLVEDVDVPAVVGFRWSATALETVPSVLLPARVLSFISINQAPELTKIPEPAGEPRLVWRSTLDASAMAAPVAALVANVLEPRARARSARGRPFRVAVVRTWTQLGYLETLFKELRFNGKSALENGDAFRQYVLDDGKDAGSAAAMIDALAAFAPDVVVVQGAPSDLVSRLVAPLEAHWPAAPLPTYVTNMMFTDDVEGFAGKDGSRRRRFFGITNVSTTMPNAQLVLHYNSVFPGEPVLRTDAPQPSYDAFYTLAYAAQAIGGDVPVTGPALSRALARLEPPGTPVDVGPSDIFRAFETLRSGGNIDLTGAIGSLDFDPATGEAPIDYAVVCFGVDDHGTTSGSVESGFVYDARAKKLRGELKCP